MNSFHTDSQSAVSYCGEDQTVVWSELDSASYDQDDVSFDWDAAGPVTSQNDWVFPGTFDELPNVSVRNHDPETANAGAFDPRFTYSSYSSAFRDHYNPIDAEFTTALLAPTPPRTDTETIASTLIEAAWDEHIIPPAQSVAELQGDLISCGSVATVPPELASLFGPGHFAGLTAAYSEGAGNATSPTPPYSDLAGTVGAEHWGSAQFTACTLGAGDVGGSQAVSRRTMLGKRPRGADEASGNQVEVVGDVYRTRQHKRNKRNTAVSGVLGAAGSTSRAHHNSATRTPGVMINDKSEVVGRGAGKLAAPNAHEVYHQSPLGSSFQRVLVGTIAQGKLPWDEGSEDELTEQYTSSAVEQQDVAISAKDGERGDESGFAIPKRLSPRHRGFLQATPEDWEHGTVDELKCRLCPDAGFRNWEDFKRHCDFSEAHPLKIVFCEHCGDFFARMDSLKRHRTNRPPECLSVTPIEAEAKRRETDKVYEAYKEKLEECLKDDEEIGNPFAQVIKEMFPSSSKRGSRQQNRLKPRVVSG